MSRPRSIFHDDTYPLINKEFQAIIRSSLNPSPDESLFRQASVNRASWPAKKLAYVQAELCPSIESGFVRTCACFESALLKYRGIPPLTLPSGNGILSRRRSRLPLAVCCHRFVMKTKLDIAALEQSIDFSALSAALTALANGESRRRQNSVSRLLDKVQTALLAARESGVTHAELTAMLQTNGISVSEATLRRYLHDHGIRHKVRRRKAKVAPNPEQLSVDLPEKSPSDLPPRLARRINN